MLSSDRSSPKSPLFPPLNTSPTFLIIMKMFLDAPNPTQVQFKPPSKTANSPPPLVLIHDGGGITFSYFILGSLHRDVRAIHNPQHGDGTP